MNFKVSSVSSAPSSPDLDTRSVLGEFNVEHSGKYLSGITPSGLTWLLVGHIYGIRDRSGRLSPIQAPGAVLSELLEESSLALAVTKLEGRFVLFQETKDNKLEVAADRYGKTEVFIQETETGANVASDLSLLDEDPASAGFNQEALVHMVTYYGYCPPKRDTIYAGVSRLGVGDFLSLSGKEISVIEVAFDPPKTVTYDDNRHKEYVDHFLGHLRSVGSDVGNVVLLSSGWDSTAILAGLVHIFGSHKVRAVTGRMRLSERSGVCNQFEIDRATKMADHFGVRIDFVDLEYLEHGHEFFVSAAEDMKRNQLYSLNTLSHGKLAEKIKETLTPGEVAFAGEISDGAHNLGFSQYATIFHPSRGFREYSDKMASYMFGPTFFEQFKAGKAEDDPVYGLFRSRNSGLKFDEADKGSEELQFLTSFFLRNGRVPLWSLDNVSLLTAEGRVQYTKKMQERYLLGPAKKLQKDNLYGTYLRLYNTFHWQGSTVRTLSIFADLAGFELDMPYWDGGLQEFLSSMPEDWGRGLDLNETKYPLKWMLKNAIDYPYEMQDGPHAYTYDVDHSFSHYEEVFVHSKMKGVFMAALEGHPYHDLLSRDYFNLAYVDEIVDRYLRGEVLSVSEIVEVAPIALLCVIGWYGKVS
jgi:hypothetical protein